MWWLDFVIRSSAILLFGLALMPLLRSQSAAWRHWLLFTTLVGAAVTPVAMWLLPEWEASLVTPTALTPWAEPFTGRINAIMNVPIADAAPPSAAASQAQETWTLSTIFTIVWLTGTALSLLALAIGLLRLRRLDVEAASVDEPLWRDALSRVTSALSTDTRVSLKMTTHPGVLVVWGAFRPTIIVSSSAMTWPRSRVDAVLQHELAHVRRQDWAALIVTEVVRAIYWFNPLVWIVGNRSRAECEIACDDVVLRTQVSGADYAAHIVAIAQDLNTKSWLPAPAIVRPSTLERRVRAMLDKTRNRESLSRRRRAGALALTGALTVMVAAVAAQSFVSLSGRIVDPSNGVLPGVRLVLTNEQTQAKYEIKTDGSGRYEFVGLPPGTYTMEAVLPGFSRFTGKVNVAAQNLQQDVTLSVGAVQESVTVTAGPPANRVTTLSPEAQQKLEARRAQAAAACAAPQAPDGTPIGGNLRVPFKVRDVKPVYPATLGNTEGVVVLSAEIRANGAVDVIDVASSTHEEFTQAAIDAVRQWEFDATRLNCEAVATPMQVTVTFRGAR